MDSSLHNLLQFSLFIALGVSIATPLLLVNVKLASRLGLIDRPKARGLTDYGVPIVGHSLVLVSLCYFGVLTYLGLVSQWFFATSCMIAVMGHLDDRNSRPATDKMIVQLGCVICVVLFDPTIKHALTEMYGPWGTFWGIFFILGLMNAINFIDGIDGLAGMVIGAGAVGFLLFTIGLPQFRHLAIYAAVLVGMIGPFLFTNVIRRKGFLGNTGSYFLSYILALLHLSLPLEASGAIARLALPGLCFLVPIADAATVLVARLGTGRSPFQADKGHLHHRLMQSQLPHRTVLAIFTGIEAFGLVMAGLIKSQSTNLPSAIPVFVCASFVVLISLCLVLVEKTSRARLKNYFEVLSNGDATSFIKYRVLQANGHRLTRQARQRLEARITSEIRISDFCFSEGESMTILLRHLKEPLELFAKRLEYIFAQEKVRAVLILEKGEFVKVASPSRQTAMLNALTN